MMKKLILVPVLFVTLHLPAQSVVEVIRAGVRKAIKAVDLKIQRMQNKVIWLQNIQRSVENTMSELKLGEIAVWVEQQRRLYDDYFRELLQVKSVLANYHRIKDIIRCQAQVVSEYRTAWSLFKQDKNFTVHELDYMYQIYAGMLKQCHANTDQLFAIVNSMMTRMSDAGRLSIINHLADETEQLLTDIRAFNNENRMISIRRAHEKGELDMVRRLYGL